MDKYNAYLKPLIELLSKVLTKIAGTHLEDIRFPNGLEIVSSVSLFIGALFYPSFWKRMVST